MDIDFVKRGKQVMDIEIAGMQSARDALGDGFTRAVELLLQVLARNGRIVVTGVGKSLHIAEKISATLASTGSTSVVLNPMQAMHGDLGILADTDALLALSFSGESDELLALVPVVKRRGIPIIAFTGGVTSSLARHSDVIVPVVIEREACPFNMAPTTSTTATLALGDALAMTLLDARGFVKEDYARLHPAGAIGRALLCRVSDIMRTGDRIATVPLSATVQDAIMAMTGAKAGSACIVEADGKLAGIFTDGDLRRLLTSTPNLLQSPVRTVMTARPTSVRQDQLAVEALRIFEQRKIDDLPVVDQTGRLAGCIDIQDLPRLKLM
ncbi:MAG: KpsF/GutQ family sugar-phosphate isomerase [Kiritimatiellia bacterium]